MESNAFAFLVKWPTLMTPLGEPLLCAMHIELCTPKGLEINYSTTIERQYASIMVHYNGKTYRNVLR